MEKQQMQKISVAVKNDVYCCYADFLQLVVLARLFFEKNLAFNLTLCPSVRPSCLVSIKYFPVTDSAQTWHKNHINSNKNSGKRIRVVRPTGPEIQEPEKNARTTVGGMEAL